PAWTADGYVAEKWAPFSPISGRIDAFEWKVPVERIGDNLIENDLDPMQRGVAPVSMVEPASDEPAPAVEVEPEEATPDIEAAEAAMPTSAATVMASAVVTEEAELEPSEGPKADLNSKEEPASHSADTAEEIETIEPAVEPAEPEEAPAIAVETEKPETVVEAVKEERTAQDEPPTMPEPIKEASEPEQEEAVVPPIPDDPGVDPNEAPAEQPRRFRLF
ncbi:MAG: hypothetical protein AAFR27_01865, partial [Pseudomonadota bacterium]